MAYIYIIQMHTGTLPARLVRAVTAYPYSHVGISLDRDCRLFYSFGRKRLYNFLVGGFVAQRCTDPIFRRFPNTRCRILELELTAAQRCRLEAALEAFKARAEDWKYDFLGAFLRALGIPAAFKNRYVCSQFAAELLERSGACRFPRGVRFAKPRDLGELSGAREIYRGPYPPEGLSAGEEQKAIEKGQIYSNRRQDHDGAEQKGL